MPDQTGVLLLLLSGALAGFVALGLIATVLEAWLWPEDAARTHDAPTWRPRPLEPLTRPDRRP